MRISLLIFSIFVLGLSANGQVTLDSTQLSATTVVTGLNIPWEIKWGPDDHIWVTEREGRVSRVDPDAGTQDIILDHTATVQQSGESGMLGMEFHPDFENTPHVYLVYTYGSSGQIVERLSRFEYDGSDLVNETVLLDNIPGDNIHDGSRLLMLSDNTLLMSTGDASTASLAQDPNSLNGKILRINLDGSIPSDNPDPNSYVYSLGHRNPQGLMLHPNGMVYSSEHGPANDDEFQIIMPGRNYGWPQVKGFCDEPSEITFCNDSNVVEPLAAWTPTIATSDIDYYDHDAIPEFEDAVLLSTLKDQKIVVLKLNAAGDSVVREQAYLEDEFGRIRDVLAGPNGTVYIATNGQSWSNTNPYTHSIIALQNPAVISTNTHETQPPEVFPNPASEVVKLRGLDEGSTNFELRNAAGELLRQGRFEGREAQLQIRELPEGLYLLMLRHREQRYSFKILKE